MRKITTLFLSLVLIISTLTGCAQPTLTSEETTSDTISESSTLETTPSELATDSDYAGFFDGKSIHEVRIDIDEADWQAILDHPEAEEYHMASITVDDVQVDDAAIRTKGNSSLKSVASSESNRYSFRINLGKYVNDQELSGLDEFVLNNMFSDPSYLREYMSYEIMREMGLNVPLTSFVNVYVNDELFGFYLMVEAIDDSFLNRSFGNNEGNLYKSEMNSTLQVESDGSYDTYEQKNGEVESKSDLISLIETLNAMPEGEKGNIESILDVDSALKYIAANMILINSDSYNGNFAQNYYLYNDDGIFSIIPWDYNMAFAGMGKGANAIDLENPITGTTEEKTPLIQKLLAVPEYKERYLKIVQEYVRILENFEATVTEKAAQIRPYVEADPSKFTTIEVFDSVTSYQEDQTITFDIETSASMMPQEGQLPPDVQLPPERQLSKDGQMPNGGFPQNGERPQTGERPDRSGFPVEGEHPLNGAFEISNKGGMGLEGSSTSLINLVRAQIQRIQEALVPLMNP